MRFKVTVKVFYLRVPLAACPACISRVMLLASELSIINSEFLLEDALLIER